MDNLDGDNKGCSKCWDDNVRVTNLLPCRHQICYDCFAELRNCAATDNITAPASVKCPVCGGAAHLEPVVRTISRMASVCGESVVGLIAQDEPCSHPVDPKKNCGHCSKVLCSECEKRHKDVIRCDIYDMTRKLSALLPDLRRVVDFRTVSLRQEDDVSKLAYYLDEKISSIMKTLNDHLFAVRDAILDESRAKLSGEITNARIKYGDFKQTKLIVSDLKNPAVYAATTLDDVIANFNIIKNQLKAVEAAATNHHPDSDTSPSPLLVEAFNGDNEVFEERLNTMTAALAESLMRGIDGKKPTKTNVNHDIGSNAVNIKQASSPVSSWEPKESPTKKAVSTTTIVPEPPKNTATNENSSDWDWECPAASNKENNVTKSSSNENKNSTAQMNGGGAFSEDTYKSLTLDRVVDNVPELSVKFVHPSWLMTCRELGNDRFAVVHNSNRISIINASTGSIVNSYRVMRPGDDSDFVLCGDLAFHDGTFYFSDSSRVRIYMMKTDFSKPFETVTPDLFFNGSQKFRGERLWGFAACKAAKQLIVVTDSAVVTIDLKDPSCVRYLLQKPTLFYYLQRLSDDESYVLFTKRRYVLRRKLTIRDGIIHLDDVEERLTSNSDLANIRGADIDPAGNVVAADRDLGRIYLFGPNGQMIKTYVPPSSSVTGRFDPCCVILLPDPTSPKIVVSEFLNNRLLFLKTNP